MASTVLYMARGSRRSQGWKIFLRNHADGLASINLFVVPTISFRPPSRLVDENGNGASR